MPSNQACRRRVGPGRAAPVTRSPLPVGVSARLDSSQIILDSGTSAAVGYCGLVGNRQPFTTGRNATR
jgi:hypothetical protein